MKNTRFIAVILFVAVFSLSFQFSAVAKPKGGVAVSIGKVEGPEIIDLEEKGEKIQKQCHRSAGECARLGREYGVRATATEDEMCVFPEPVLCTFYFE